MLLALLHLLLFCGHIVAQDASPKYNLSAVLSAQKQLTNFTTILSLFPDLHDRAIAGNITMLAPTDQAFEEYLSVFGNFSNTTTLRAGLTYHMIEGHYTPLDFEKGLQFLPTLLTDPAHSNVTGGQRVGVYSTEHGIQFESGSKTRSNLTTTNIIYSAPEYGLGIIHIIDKVLKFPVDALTTATETGLNGVVDLSVNLPVNPRVEGAFGSISDWTLFLPTGAAVDISDWPPEIVFDIQEYHFVPGYVIYSPNLTDQMQLVTFSGPNLTITIAPNGTKYVNDARIISSDYLTNTGVMHIIDHGLSPNMTEARPNFSNTTNTTITPSLSATPVPIDSAHPSLSTAAKAGIGVAVGVVALFAIGALYFFLRRRRSPEPEDVTTVIPELKDQPISEMQHPDKAYKFEADGVAIRVQRELDSVEQQKPKPKPRPTVFYEMQ